MKKFLTSLLIGMLVIALGTTSINASEIVTMGAGKWDYVGSDTHFVVSTKWNTTHRVKSQGGDFAIEVIRNEPEASLSTIEVTLYEGDESGNPPELVGTRYVNSSGGGQYGEV